MKSTSYVLSFRMVFFYLVTTGWIFDISLCENSINQSINRKISIMLPPRCTLEPTTVSDLYKSLIFYLCVYSTMDSDSPIFEPDPQTQYHITTVVLIVSSIRA